MKSRFYRTGKKIFIALLSTIFPFFTAAPPGALAGAAPFSFDSVWYYRDGIRVVPEISRQWLTVVFPPRQETDIFDSEPADDADDGFIRNKAKAIIKSQPLLVDYLYDPNISEEACFFRMRNGMKQEDIRQLINRLNNVGNFKYVHPALTLNDKTFAFFNILEMEWKTGVSEAERESLLKATHAVLDEGDEKGKRYLVDVRAIPFFKALNLLSEDVRVLRVTPYLVEIRPSISARLSLFMRGGGIGDSIPFSLNISFSDRVSIDPSSIATLNLRPQEIQKELFDCAFDPYDYAKTVRKSPIVITGRLRFFTPGEFAIPSIRISYSCPSCANSTVRSLDTDPVPFRVSSMIPKDKSENRLIVTTDTVTPDFRLAALHNKARLHLWLAVIFAAGIIPCAFWILLMQRRSSAERKRVRERKRDDRLAEQLRSLLNSAPTSPHWVYMGEVGSLFREYLLEISGVDPKYKGGSVKQFMETISGHVHGECMESLRGIFTAIDNSVALESEDYQGIDLLQQEILKVMDSSVNNIAA